MNSRTALTLVIVVIVLFLIAGLGIYYKEISNCENYPMLSTIEETMVSQRNLIQQIKGAAPEHIDVIVEEVQNCEGRGRIIIIYSTLNGKNEILRLLPNSKSFFGVPIKFRNV